MKKSLFLILATFLGIALSCSSRKPTPITKKDPITQTTPDKNENEKPSTEAPQTHQSPTEEIENTNDDKDYINSNDTCSTKMKQKKDELKQVNESFFVFCYQGPDSISACLNLWDKQNYNELKDCDTSGQIHKDSLEKKSPIFLVYKKTSNKLLFNKYLNIKSSIDEDIFKKNIQDEINKFIQ